MRELNDLKLHKHIVFGAEHYNPLGLVRSLGENGIRPIGIILRNERRLTSYSKYFTKIYFVDSINEGYDLLLNKFYDSNCKSFIYTSDDIITGYLDERYDDLKGGFYFFNAGQNNQINHYMDKYNICQLAKECGLPLADTIEVKKGEIPSDIEYPIITKAITSKMDNWKADSFICKNKEELTEAYKKIKSEKILIQKYIEKKNELCLDGFVYDKGKQMYITIASEYNYILPNTYSSLMTVKNFEDDELKYKLSEMFKKIGFEGIFSIEFLIGPEDELYFLEINFRNSTWSYASTVAGMSLPIMWAKGMLGLEDGKQIKTISSPFVAIAEFDEYIDRVKSGRISKINWIKEILKSKCKYYFSIKDPKPVLNIIWLKIKKVL